MPASIQCHHDRGTESAIETNLVCKPRQEPRLGRPCPRMQRKAKHAVQHINPWEPTLALQSDSNHHTTNNNFDDNKFMRPNAMPGQQHRRLSLIQDNSTNARAPKPNCSPFTAHMLGNLTAIPGGLKSLGKHISCRHQICTCISNYLMDLQTQCFDTKGAPGIDTRAWGGSYLTHAPFLRVGCVLIIPHSRLQELLQTPAQAPGTVQSVRGLSPSSLRSSTSAHSEHCA